MDHRLALALCIVCGTFGGAIVFAFLAAFSQVSILGRSIEIARQRSKGFGWWYFISGFVAAWQIWKETKGFRWLIPIGGIFCLLSYVIYHVYLTQT
jgi:hypothetical protein